MFVLIVSAVYPPEPVVSARTSYGLAKMLHDRGHRVLVFAPFPSRPAGKRYPGFPKKVYWRQESAEGVEAVRCASISSSRSTLASRFIENLSFGLTAGWRLLRQRPRPDLIYSNTWPLFATGLLVLASRLCRIPIILHIKDVYPESLLVQKRITKDGWLSRILHRLDRWIANECMAIVVLSNRFARLYAEDREVEPRRIYVVPDWVDDRIWQLQSDNELGLIREKHGIPKGAFLLVYAGNIGEAAGVEGLLDAFASLQDLPAVHLLIAGEGSHLEYCQRMVKDQSIGRIYFHNPWAFEETASVLLDADALILPTRGAQSHASMPSKLVDYLYAGHPLIVAANPDTELARVIEQAGCGWVTNPDIPESMAQAIRLMVNVPTVELVRMGKAGREYALNNFSKSICLPRLVEFVESAAGPLDRNNRQNAKA